MSEVEDRESKTEEPTEKKLSEAAEKGNVPLSREAVTFGSFCALLIALEIFALPATREIAETLRLLLGASGVLRLDDREAAQIVIASLLSHVAMALLPVVMTLALGSIIGALLQNPPHAAFQRLAPQLSRISPSAGWKRIFGLSGLGEFVKLAVKCVVVTAIALLVMRSQLGEVAAMLIRDPTLTPMGLLNVLLPVVASLTVAALILGIGDIAWSRMKWRRDLRMSRQELKEEHKEAEGDPLLKSRIRTIARQRTSRRMMKKVPTATLVITNPTHYAVALRYVREENAAPVVVAKGIDHVALRIKSIADEKQIPIIENRSLARALYDRAPLDSMIPEEFYRAVAEIIHFLHMRRAAAPQPHTR